MLFVFQHVFLSHTFTELTIRVACVFSSDFAFEYGEIFALFANDRHFLSTITLVHWCRFGVV